MTLRNNILVSLAVSIMLMLAFVGILFFAEGAGGFPFPPFDFMDFLIRTLPGDVITFGIDTMVDIINGVGMGENLDDIAKTAEQVQGVVFFIIIGTLIGTAYGVFAQNLHKKGQFLSTEWATGLGIGILIAIPVAIISAEYNVSATTSVGVSTLWILVASLGWGLAHNWAQRRLAQIDGTPEATPSAATSAEATTPTASGATPATPLTANTANSASTLNRRQFLVALGGATATVTVIGAGLGELLRDSETIVGENLVPETVVNALSPAPGTRSEYTPLDIHYRIDINAGRAPHFPDDWTLQLTGLVDEDVSLSLEDIRANYEPMDQLVTLSCISNSVGGSLIGTTRWTGTSMQNILADVPMMETASHIKITSRDGFFEIISIEDIMNDERIMLTYEWDGVPLPGRHGFPLRIYIPDHYGMKQPKWIDAMEFIDEWEEGYWVRRGWDREARVKATSVIDTVAVSFTYENEETAEMMVPIGGIAYSGARGISKVEVQIDDGEWMEAELREPLSDLTWVLWRLDWAFTPGEHTFRVRTQEGDGTPQIEEIADKRPSGATGIHRETVEL